VQILEFLKAALPNEAAAFILWNEASREFAVEFPDIDEATPTRLVYRMPRLPPDWHMVCDIHSHSRGRAFFSATDDADDAHATKIAIVFGRLDHPDGPTGRYVPALAALSLCRSSRCRLIRPGGTIFLPALTIVRSRSCWSDAVGTERKC
jgi:hypothetical protein